MEKQRATQKQVGSLDGPYQVFSLVTEVELSPGRWEVSSELFLVCLENFGPILGFLTEKLASADAERWNADFFNRLGSKIQQDRLKHLMVGLDERRQALLKNALNIASVNYGPGSENIPSPSTRPSEGAKDDLNVRISESSKSRLGR